MNGTDRD